MIDPSRQVKPARQLARHHQSTEARQRRIGLADQDPSERSASLTVITLRVTSINSAGGLEHLASVSHKPDGKPRICGVFRYLSVSVNTLLTEIRTVNDLPYPLI